MKKETIQKVINFVITVLTAVQKARWALTPATTTPIASVSATRVVSTRKASLPILALQPRKHLWKTFSTVSSSTIPMPKS